MNIDNGIEKESTKKMERFGNEAAHGLGRFGCLPEDVFMSILNRIHDLKCLFQFTLVSKDFASKTHLIKSISLQLPAFVMDSTEAPTNIFHLSGKVLRVEFQETSKPHTPPSPRQEPKFTKFLQKFTQLECASFEAVCPQTPCDSPSLKWKVKLGNCGPAVQMLVSVLPSPSKTVVESESGEEDGEDEDEEVEEDSEEEYGEGEDEDEDEEVEEDSEEEEEEQEVGIIHESPKHLAKGFLLFSLMSFAEWFDIMFSLIQQHDALKSVIFTDAGKHGKIVLNAEQIVEWRKRLLCGELSHNPIPRNIINGWVPSPGLPLPGHSMNGSLFVIMNFVSSPASGYDILKRFEYDQEEKEVADTVKRLLTKAHSSCTNIIR